MGTKWAYFSKSSKSPESSRLTNEAVPRLRLAVW
jgi:hypothetical protein